MSESDARMVMRSVYLPEAMDEELRNAAYRERTSKSELIRRYVANGLAQLVRELSEERIARNLARGQHFLGRRPDSSSPASEPLPTASWVPVQPEPSTEDEQEVQEVLAKRGYTMDY